MANAAAAAAAAAAADAAAVYHSRGYKKFCECVLIQVCRSPTGLRQH